MKLFIYGSLKRGFSNHHFLAGQTYLGDAFTIPTGRLYDCHGYPGLIACEDGTPIQGELWEIDSACERLTDWLEDIDQGIYVRQTWSIRVGDEIAQALIYLYARPVTGLTSVGPEWKKAADVLPPCPIPEGNL